MNNNYYCVILAGGSGRDFWPIGKMSRPLQFLDFAGTGKSYLMTSYQRCKKVFPQKNILITTLASYKDIVKQQIPDIPNENILVEPYRKDTAACIAYATYAILQRNPNAIITISPSDLMIMDEDEFVSSMNYILDSAEKNDAFITTGIKPTYPNTNYGYIQVRNEKNKPEGPFKVKTFTEKPDRELAEIFIQSGEFYWNSGIYTCKASVLKDEMETLIPQVTNFFTGWENCLGSEYESEFIDRAYQSCSSVSISYALLEKTNKNMLIPATFGWADVGNWFSLYDSYPDKDNSKNYINSNSKLLDKTENCLVITKNQDKLVAIKGLKDFMVIDSDDVLLICPKDYQSFKELVSGAGMPEYDKFK